MPEPKASPPHEGFRFADFSDAVRPGFSGGLAELAQALRSRRLAPHEVDVLMLVRQFLGYYQKVAAHDLELATETLPQLARVVELKARLLLPQPRLEPEEESALEETAESIDMLAELEEAIQFLRQRREGRRLIMPVRVARPPYPRDERAIRLPLARLAELAGRYKTSSYFELAVDRLTMAAAMRTIIDRLAVLKRSLFRRLCLSEDWAGVSVSFAGMLELVKEGDIRAQQQEPFGPIEVELLEAESESQEAA